MWVFVWVYAWVWVFMWVHPLCVCMFVCLFACLCLYMALFSNINAEYLKTLVFFFRKDIKKMEKKLTHSIFFLFLCVRVCEKVQPDMKNIWKAWCFCREKIFEKMSLKFSHWNINVSRIIKKITVKVLKEVVVMCKIQADCNHSEYFFSCGLNLHENMWKHVNKYLDVDLRYA